MKVTGVDCHVLVDPAYERDATSSNQDTIVVEVHTDEGITGIGETDLNAWVARACIQAPGTHTMDIGLGQSLVGMDPLDPEAAWDHLYVGTAMTGRRGALVHALGAIDMALWDIAGKRAGLPVHELLGGKVRAAADTYIHAGGRDIRETLDRAEEFAEQGWRHVRLQVGQPGIGTYGAAPVEAPARAGAPYPRGWDPRAYLATTPTLFEEARVRFGDRLELLHDVHSRLTPKEAVVLARALEPYRLFFLEDVIAPEHWDRLPEVRSQSPVPIAVGELATSLTEAARLITGGGVDFIRAHISAIGGLTPAKKLATLAEFSGVRTAWHAPGDTSPIGAAANVAVDVTTSAFGIQEGHVYSEAVHEVFPGTLEIVDGWLTPHDAPGWGIEVDERAAARFPAGLSGHDAWAAGVRGLDGGLHAP